MSSVYIVDDHEMVREGLRGVLQLAGHEVVGESGEVAHALQSILRLNPDVVLLDLHLEQNSGLSLLMELMRRKASSAVVVLTMSAQPRHVAEALRHGAMGYVLKGSSSRELMSAIDHATRGLRFLGSRVADLALQSQLGSGATSALESLSMRERQILDLVVRGRTSASIAVTLSLSPKTVETYRSRLMAKLNVPDVTALVRFAIAEGLIDSH